MSSLPYSQLLLVACRQQCQNSRYRLSNDGLPECTDSGNCCSLRRSSSDSALESLAESLGGVSPSFEPLTPGSILETQDSFRSVHSRLTEDDLPLTPQKGTQRRQPRRSTSVMETKAEIAAKVQLWCLYVPWQSPFVRVSQCLDLIMWQGLTVVSDPQ